MTNTIWPDERVEKLKALNNERMTATEMARELSNGVLITRSAVLGKLHRLGIPLQSYGASTYGKTTPKDRRNHLTRQILAVNVRTVKAPIQPDTDINALQSDKRPDPLNIDIFDLKERHCRWPYGNGPLLFCGHDNGGANPPYCHYHKRLATNR